MNRATFLVPLVSAVLLEPVQAAQGQGRTAAPTTGAIHGVVLAMDSRTPVRAAEVRVVRDLPPMECTPTLRLCEPRLAVTDDEGRYELLDVPSGLVRVTVSKTGFVGWQYGQRRPFERPAAVRLNGGEELALDIAIPRASAISGRIHDEYGAPVAGAPVSVYRGRMVQGRRQLVQAGRGDITDDTGAFRLYGLPPGEYYVAASLRVAPTDSVVDTTYAPTYYPGTGNFGEAQRITLEVASEATAVFQLQPVRHVRVSGSVFTSAGAPARAFLNLMSDGAELGVPLGIGGATREDGSFTLPDIAPGRYMLYASLRDSGGEGAEMPLTVGFDDVSGLSLVTARGATLRGAFAGDQGVTRRLPRGLGITARSPKQGGPMTAGSVTGDRFEVTAPPGAFRLEVHNLPDEWMVTRILIDDEDITDQAIDLRSRQDAVARVVLTDRVTELRGRVFATGTSRAHTVVVFPEDPNRWTNASRYLRSVRVGADGTFRVAGLPPGVPYLALAVDYLEEGEGDDPEFLARMVAGATAFALAPGEARTLDLGVISR